MSSSSNFVVVAFYHFHLYVYTYIYIYMYVYIYTHWNACVYFVLCLIKTNSVVNTSVFFQD